MTLLELIQQVTAELGLDPPPTAIVGTTDAGVRQLFALVKRLGNDLVRQHQWQRLTAEHIITTQAVQRSATSTVNSITLTVPDTSGLSTDWAVFGVGIQPFAQIVSVGIGSVTLNMAATASGTNVLNFARVAYPVPSDWAREIPQSEWDRTNRWPLAGPQSSQNWQSFKSGIVYAGPRLRFRILGNAFVLNPQPAANTQLALEYISSAWVRSVAGQPLTEFQADTDTYIFPDSLMVTGLKTQWKMAKGLDASFDVAEFRGLLEQAKAQDKSAPRLNMSPMNVSVLGGLMNIPDGNWPGG